MAPWLLICPGLLCARSSTLAAPGISTTPLDPNRLEPGAVPLISSDTDRGFGFGVLGSLARFRPGVRPYDWRLQATAYVTARQEGDDIELPFQTYEAKLDLPGLLGGRLRLLTQLGYKRASASSYYGLGNTSPPCDAQPERFHLYRRTLATIRQQARVSLASRISLFAGGEFTQTWIGVYPGSKLEQDLDSDDPLVQALLQGADSQGVAQATLGGIWDSRDQELAPSRGAFHDVSWRLSPTHAFAGFNTTLRLYRSLVGDSLVLAGRLMVDMLMGRPPFHELMKHGGLRPGFAPGGAEAVRGVPVQRYYGKVKALANLELRARLLPFTLARQRFNLGLVGFVDGGRVWCEYAPTPQLDGSGLGLKLGLGGGLRLQWGQAFLLRFDAAWSPDARPVGLYFNVDHIF